MGKKIALLIGVSNYEILNKLSPCDADIALMSDIILASGKYDDKLILRDSPKRIDAIEKIRSFITSHQNSDIDEVFFYYTGHGLKNSNDFLFLFSDFDESKKNATSLANSDFDEMLKSLAPKLMIKVVDACQAGVEYIKSEQDSEKDLEKILIKSSKTNGFKYTYFLFSSLGNQSSIALSDYSVFTKSFADALINYKGHDVSYLDITKHIADDSNVKKHQTPLFIQQATNTEIFCHVSDELVEKISYRFNNAVTIKNESDGNPQSNQTLTIEEKLVAVLDNKNKEYCTEEEAQISFSKMIELIKNYKWDAFSKIYEVSVFNENIKDYVSITGMKSIAKWLEDNNNESYFAKVIYIKDSYEEQVRTGFNMIFSGGEYKTITKYRNIPNTIQQTAQSPCCSIIINFSPYSEATPWFKAFIVYIFSKNKLTLFYKYETEKEVNWNDRVTLNENEWKIRHCSLKNTNEIVNKVTDILNDINESIIKELTLKFDVSLE